MSITMSMLLDILQPFGLIQRGRPWTEGTFDCINLFSANIVEYCPTTLYIATGREMERFHQTRHMSAGQQFCAICVTDKNTELPPEDDRITLLLIPDSFHFAYVFNCVSNLFSGFYQWLQEVDRAAFSGETLEGLLDLGRKRFDNPFIVWDSTFNFCAVSAETPVKSSYLKKMIDQNRFPIEVVQRIIAQGLLASKEEYDKRIRILPKEETLANGSYHIRHFFEEGRRTYSVCMVAINNDPTPGQEDLLQIFFEKVGEFLKRQNAGSSGYQYIYEAFLKKLIAGEMTEPWEIEDRAVAFGIPFKQSYLLYTIDFDNFSQSQAEFLVYSLRQTLTNEQFVIYENKVCLLKAVNAYSCDRGGSMERFDRLLDTYNAYCGLSRVFHDLTGCRTAFIQSSVALQLGKRLRETASEVGTSHIFPYRDYAIYHMMEMCQEQVDLFSLLPKRLVHFCREDLKNGGTDVELLDAFMQNGMSVSATAQAVFLHRNSVTYRIKRIEEQCNLNLSEKESILNVLFMLKILRYFGEIKGDI